MSSSKEVLFLRVKNGEQKWFENGNEDSDGKYIGEIKNGKPNFVKALILFQMERSMKGNSRMGKNMVKGH